MIRRAATTLAPMRASLLHRALPQRIGSGFPRARLLASSTKAPPSTAPRLDVQGKEAIEKAERMHSELSQMIAAQKTAPMEKSPKKAYIAGFVSFLKASKPEIVNIFFAFVCVLLAYQIHGMRAGIRKLLAEREERDAEINRLRGVLAGLSSAGQEAPDGDEQTAANDSLSMKVARRCAEAVRGVFEASEKRVGYSWILGKKLASGDAMEMDRLADEMNSIILNEIQAAVGDAAFTEEELKERRVAALKAEREITRRSGSEGNRTDKGDAQMGGLMEILEEVHNKDLVDGRGGDSEDDDGSASTKVRRTRYAI